MLCHRHAMPCRRACAGGPQGDSAPEQRANVGQGAGRYKGTTLAGSNWSDKLVEVKKRKVEEGAAAYGAEADETIGAFEAKTHLSRLLREVSSGKRILITQRGKPVAELVPPQRKTGPVRGDMKGEIHIADDFCEALPDLDEFFSS